MQNIRAVIAILVAGCLSFSVLAKPAKQLPPEVWADSLNISSLDMSPDAKRIAMLMRRDRGAISELMIFETDNIKGTLQAIQPEGLIPSQLFWANDKYLVVNFVIEDEDINRPGRPTQYGRTASYNVETKEWTSLVRTTTAKDIRKTGDNTMEKLGNGSVVNSLPDEPNHVIVSHRESRTGTNYYKVDIRNGKRELVLKGNSRLFSYIWDRQGNARAAQEYDPDGPSFVSVARMSPEDDWKEVGRLVATNRDRFQMLGFYDPKRPYLATIRSDSKDGNFMGIYNVDIRTGKRELVFQTEEYDAMGVITSPRLADGRKIVGYTYADKKGMQPYYIDEVYGPLHYGLQQAFPDRNVSIRRVSDDGKTTLIFTRGPQDPGSYYLFRDGKLVPIIPASTEITAKSLSPVKVITYKARDGLEVSGYVTIPAGSKGPVPTIAMPHGGPWVRDYYGYDRWAQMLSNRGYAVFQPNYRGSTELGKSFWLAGDNKWGNEMQNDIDDGMKYLVDQGIADPKKLAIFGWSYGGYAAFVAATQEDSMYNCVASGAGVSDLTQIRGGISSSRFAREFQKPTVSGVSPIDRVSNVKVPMLVVHGDYDSTVLVEHSRRFVDGLKEIGADYEYIEIEDMRHNPTFYNQYRDNIQWYPALLDFFDDKCNF